MTVMYVCLLAHAPQITATSAGKGPDSRGRAHPLSVEAALELLDGTGVLLGADGNLCREGTRLKRKSSSSEHGGGAGATGRDRSASRSRRQPLQGRDQTQEEELIL